MLLCLETSFETRFPGRSLQLRSLAYGEMHMTLYILSNREGLLEIAAREESFKSTK